MEIIFIMFIIIGGLIFILQSGHLLIILLSLEIMVLGIFGVMSMMILNNMGEEMTLMLFLVFSVCEGSVGLGLLVFFVRSFGNDYLNNFSMMWY